MKKQQQKRSEEIIISKIQNRSKEKIPACRESLAGGFSFAKTKHRTTKKKNCYFLIPYFFILTPAFPLVIIIPNITGETALEGRKIRIFKFMGSTDIGEFVEYGRNIAKDLIAD